MATKLRIALVGGPMYNGLYDRIPAFEKESGLKIEIGFKGDHPALNEHLAEHGSEFDLVSTHSKYAPSQAGFLKPLNELISESELEPFEASTIGMMTFKGNLLQVPRVIDSKIILYRKDLWDDANLKERFEEEHGEALAVPQTWDDLAKATIFLKRNTAGAGMVFPGKESGLFGHFYEILESAGGELFTPDLEPGFISDAGRYAVSLLVRLYKEAAPEEVPEWHYDEVAACFLRGEAALTTDWPGGYHVYQNSESIGDKFDVAIYPVGPSGKRRVYSGGHSFALTTGTKDVPAALSLLRFLTSHESQLHEARLGSVVPRREVMAQIRSEAEPGSREAKRIEILGRTMSECMAIPPKFSHYPTCEDALWASIRKALKGEFTVEEALEGAAAAVRAVAKAE